MDRNTAIAAAKPPAELVRMPENPYKSPEAEGNQERREFSVHKSLTIVLYGAVASIPLSGILYSLFGFFYGLEGRPRGLVNAVGTCIWIVSIAAGLMLAKQFVGRQNDSATH